MRLLLLVLVYSVPVHAGERCVTRPEPALPVLLERAVAHAGLEPARVATLQRRARLAALLPRLQARVGKGTYDYVRNADSLDASVVSSKTWHAEGMATWQLDHLVFSPAEAHAAEVAGRLAERRATLLDRVVQLWTARRAADAGDGCTALGALLDEATGGGLQPPATAP